MEPVLRFTDKGIYCPQGNFYIDPWRPVESAVITHAHSDHARWGSSKYLAHKHSAPILRLRLGHGIKLQTVEYNQPVVINGGKVSLHPAGHIIGSAQIRVEYKGCVWVVSGDYKTENDGISGQFELVKCHAFISESTFGLPVYRWKKQSDIFTDINNWWQQNRASGKRSILFGYSLGKAQRILANIDKSIGPVVAHTAVANVQNALADSGLPVGRVNRWVNTITKADLDGALIIAPGSADDSPWMKRFEPYSTGVCSGWMQIRGMQRRRNADRGFVLSDHADWDGLVSTIKATGAGKVFITHGYQALFARYLNETGIDAREVTTEYGDDAIVEDIAAEET